MKFNWKKVICILLLCALSVIMLTSCDQNSTPEITQWAVLYMPDGSVIEGVCDSWQRWSSGMVDVTIDGTHFYCAEWRVVIYGIEN